MLEHLTACLDIRSFTQCKGDMFWRWLRPGRVRLFVPFFLSRPPSQAARGLPRTQRHARTGAMLDSYAERCNDIMFPINLDELDGPIAVNLMVME
jgi:hypothetical protein